MKYIRKYWWGIIILIIVFYLPKIVDLTFGVYLGEFTSLKHITASDYLQYIGVIIGGVCTLIAIIVAIKQFSTDKKPIIIPRNKRFFIYLNYGGRWAFAEDPDMEYNINNTGIDTENPLLITFDNVTENAALAFDLRLDYNHGKYYREVCNLIGGEPYDKLSSNYDADDFFKQGVFNSKSIKTLPMPTNLEFIIKGIIYRLSEPGICGEQLSLRYNNFIRKTYKIAEIIMKTKDINGKTNTSIFDLELDISHLLACKANYTVLLTFIMRD